MHSSRYIQVFFYLVVCGEIVLLFITCSFHTDGILSAKVIFRRVVHVSTTNFCKVWIHLYDFNAIQSNAIFGGMEGWGYRKIKLFGNMYACLYFTFFLVDKMNHKLKQLMKCTYTFAEYKNERWDCFVFENSEKCCTVL